MAVSLVVYPATKALNKGQKWQFHADVSGGSQKVTWAASTGTISASGEFTPPTQTASPQTITLTATSVDDGSKTATATVTYPARNGNKNADFTASATINGESLVSVTLPTTKGRTAPTTVTIDEYTVTIPRGVQTSVRADVKTFLDSIGATAA